MARKNRTPEPPKGPRGPRPTSTEAARRRRRIWILVGATAVGVLAIVLAAILAGGGDGGGGEKEEQAALQGAGCTLESFPALPNENDHADVPTLSTKPEWNSNPPTSGPHYREWALWGFYDEEVPLVKTVHNLEHGGVVIHYGPEVPRAELEQLRTFYDEDPNGILVAPLATNGDKITLGAWTAPDAATGTSDRGRGWLARCTTFDEDAFAAFLEAHRYKGPERLLPDQLAPGS